MGNIITGESKKIMVEIKKREYKIISVKIPYNQLSMIRVLQKEFDYEVKGTIYVDHNHEFVSFEVRTDSSEIYSYGASDWRISFHTHPDKTAQKYGVRYFSPPSVDDVLEIYDHNLEYIPVTTKSGFGELSIVFANEGIYVLQVNRDNFKEFNKDNLPIEGLQAVLEATLTDYMVSELKKGIYSATDGRTIDTVIGKDSGKVVPKIKERSTTPVPTPVRAPLNLETPDIPEQQFATVVKRLGRKVSELYGFDMTFYSWKELEADGLNLKVSDYFLKKVID